MKYKFPISIKPYSPETLSQGSSDTIKVEVRNPEDYNEELLLNLNYDPYSDNTWYTQVPSSYGEGFVDDYVVDEEDIISWEFN